MERFFSALSAGNATTMVLVTTELLGFYTISTMLLLRWVWGDAVGHDCTSPLVAWTSQAAGFLHEQHTMLLLWWVAK